MEFIFFVGATNRAPCQDRNMTLYVTSDEERALIEVSPSVNTSLSVGSHVINEDNCTINITVINNGEYTSN